MAAEQERREWSAAAENPPEEEQAAELVRQLCEQLSQWWNSTAE